jgi:hypothetical protein
MIIYCIVPPIPTIQIRCKLHMNINNRNLTPCFKNSCKSMTACEMCVDNVVCGHAVERASRGKSGCECKCRFPNTRGLHRSSGDAPLETNHSPHWPWGHVHESNSSSLRQTKLAAVASGHKKREFTSHSIHKKYETACETCVDNVVCGRAVERASGGKSGCECKCHFPKTGGLHRTSGDALLETHHSPHPPWCHVHKSNSPSSRRTQVLAVAYIHKMAESTKHSIIHRRLVNANNKSLKQFYHLKDVKVCSVVSKKIKYLTLDYIKKNIVVCDGGDNECDSIQNTLDFENVCYLQIRDGGLWVADKVNYCKGLRYMLPGKLSPVFICLPRNNALAILINGLSICQAMSMCAMTQRQSLSRGKGTCVFTERGNKYCCIDSQPGRAERGVLSGLYRMKYGFPCKDWDTMHKLPKQGEYAFDKFIDTDIIQHISCAQSRVKFNTMTSYPCSLHKKEEGITMALVLELMST